MDFKEYVIGPDDCERRADRIVRKLVREENLSSIYKAFRKGLIKINDKKTAAEYHVLQGDILKIASFLVSEEKTDSENEKKQFNLDVIFKNQHILVIQKPYDVTVHGSSDSLDRIVQDYYSTLPQSRLSVSFKPGPLHRLDKRTTGLLAFSLSLSGAKWFSENIAVHTIRKTYLGIVTGKLLLEETWKDNLLKEESEDPGFHTVKVVNGQEGKEALTYATPLGFGKYKDVDFTLVQFEIVTGRTHQIRLQSSTHGYPLLGDTVYGGKPVSGKIQLFLHAWKLSIPEDNPCGLPLELKAPLPLHFKAFLETNNCRFQFQDL